MTRWLLPLLLLVLALARPAQAATALWGYGGLLSVPDARILSVREVELGLSAYTSSFALPSLPLGNPAVAGWARMGVWDGLEADLAYGLPRTPNPALTLKYQFWRPTPAVPMAMAVGLALLGSNPQPQFEGTHYFVVMTRSWPWLTAHLGFAGDFGLNARLMAGLELPLPGALRLEIDGQGPQRLRGGVANLGLEWQPVAPVRLLVASMGTYDRPFEERSLGAGASVRFTLPDWPSSVPLPKPSQAPLRPAPLLPKSPAGALTPPPLPAATLIARVLGKSGEPMAGYQLRLSPSDRQGTTTAQGYCFFGGLEPGTYHLRVSDPAGGAASELDVEIREPGPVRVTVPADGTGGTLSLRSVLAGTVTDPEARPLPDARLVLEGRGVSLISTSDKAGRFRIVDLPAGTYRLSARGKGSLTGSTTVQVASASVATIDLQLRRSAP